MEEIYQGNLFDDCSTKCEAYAACGGHRHTAPCGCAWPLSSKLYHKCNDCYIICRERGINIASQETKDFAKEIENGYTLDQVSLQQPKHDLPIFIPSYTNKYSGNEKFTDFVAVDVRMLFNCRRRKGAVLKDNFRNEDSVRQHLNVTSTCKLIAIFNGLDWMLESFWAMARNAVLEQLASIGFTICTAPTFSLTALTTEGTPVPFSHHTAMLMRHHRVLSEIAFAGICAIPNLYWLDGDQREICRWSDWLKKNTQIYTVSRDFTSTRDWQSIEVKISDLIGLLNQTERFFHVLIIGTGAKNAGKIVEKLTKNGHSVSIITSAPIMKAIHGSKYFINNLGKLSDSACPKSEHSFSSLIKYNLKMFEKNLIHSYR